MRLNILFHIMTIISLKLTFPRPILILRNATERKELLSKPYVKLVGTEEDGIFLAAKEFLENEQILKNGTADGSLRSHESISKAIADIIEQIKGK